MGVSFSVQYSQGNRSRYSTLSEFVWNNSILTVNILQQNIYSQLIPHWLSVFIHMIKAHNIDLYNQKMTLLKEQDCFWSWPHLRQGLFTRQWTFILAPAPSRVKHGAGSEVCVLLLTWLVPCADASVPGPPETLQSHHPSPNLSTSLFEWQCLPDWVLMPLPSRFP